MERRLVFDAGWRECQHRGHHPPGMMGKNAWGRVLENYERLRRDGKLPATFEVIYGHAWKPQPKYIADGRVIIKTQFKL